MASNDTGASRPLSPHLSIYRFHFSMALSILHRASGVAMTGALVLFIVWLWAAAYDGSLFESISDILRSTLGMILLALTSFVFYFKFATGLRHLWWDTGRGFALKSIDTSGVLAIIFTVFMTGLTWGFVYMQYCQE
ncbi:MAG: succinate dehydrogenase, cytochrome b556 subunit [Alphaproteobacteria bacterium]|nr:succinate dehydrogenase, cytochrome b556 subunit [Alphaproteobacteria bacterium]